jgi:hypothetical protein
VLGMTRDAANEVGAFEAIPGGMDPAIKRSLRVWLGPVVVFHRDDEDRLNRPCLWCRRPHNCDCERAKSSNFHLVCAGSSLHLHSAIDADAIEDAIADSVFLASRASQRG